MRLIWACAYPPGLPLAPCSTILRPLTLVTSAGRRSWVSILTTPQLHLAHIAYTASRHVRA